MYAHKDIKRGSELFISYGNKSNWGFFVPFGFVLRDNKYDDVGFDIPMRADDPLFEKKMDLIGEYKRDGAKTLTVFNVKKHFIFEAGTSLDDQILRWTRFVVYEGDMQALEDNKTAYVKDRMKKLRELKEFEQEPDSDEEEKQFCPKRNITFISKDNEIKMWTYLHEYAKKTLAGYPTTIEED